MKQYLTLSVFSLILFVFAACNGKQEENLALFSPEAFAFQIDDNSYDVNAKVFVKGFLQTEDNGVFTHSLSYSVDIQTPEGKNVEGIFKAKEDTPRGEKVGDLPLEAQFELDSLYTPGKYKLTFSVKDEKAGKTAKIEKELELE